MIKFNSFVKVCTFRYGCACGCACVYFCTFLCECVHVCACICVCVCVCAHVHVLCECARPVVFYVLNKCSYCYVTTAFVYFHKPKSNNHNNKIHKDKHLDLSAHCVFQDDGSETFLTLQRYFRLEENGKWQPVADVRHAHMATPLTVLSVSEEKVFVVKATITLNLEKSMLIIQEGHVFDSARGKSSGACGYHLHTELFWV